MATSQQLAHGQVSQVAQDMIGKVAFVTGSSQGMGKAFAVALAKRGCNLVIHHRKNPEEAELTAQEIRGLGRKVLIVQGDLNTVGTVEKVFPQIMAAFGRIDIVVNNAAFIYACPIGDTTEAQYDEIFAVNTKVPFFIMKECAKHMSDNGRVINITTTSLGELAPMVSTYVGSKAALEHFSRSFSKEVGPRGITVNMVAPGPVSTVGLLNFAPEFVLDTYKTQASAGRLGEINDIVPAVEFLASPAAQWVTAQTIFVNGGIHAR
ncbi:hypothetical protein BGZ98_002964 [Dissophora globulifera]|nr:hypothetical protein BGZ98_002964 [Dissophora globulifera]